MDNRCSGTAGLFQTADLELVTLSHFPHRLQPTGPQPSDPQDTSLGSLVKTALVLSPSPDSIPRIETPPVSEPSFSATTNDTRQIVDATPLPQNGHPTASQTGPPTKRVTALGHRKGMTIASLNVNSLLLHIDEIRMLVNELGIHILALNETKLDKSIDDSLVGIEGYTLKRCDRDRHGGGVAIYIKDTLLDKCTMREDLPKSNLELVCIEIKLVRAAPFFVLAWYRPPNVSDGFDQMEECLQFLDREDKETILLGDTNCDFLPKYSREGDTNPNDLPAHSLRLLELYNLFGLHQLIESPTRETLTTTTLIDHIATTNKSNIVSSGIHKSCLSDHYLIFCVRKFRGSCKKQHKNISTRQMKNFDQNEFINDVLGVDWRCIVRNIDDINVVVNNWTKTFSLILEKHAPTCNRRVSDKFCPWLTNDFKLMCKARDNLKKRAIRTKSELLIKSYKQVRNQVNKLNEQLKREYFTHKIASCEGDLKNTWKTINNVLNKKSKTTNISSISIEGKHISSSAGIAESMNNFFCTIGETLSGKIPRAKNPLLENDYDVNPLKTMFNFHVIDTFQLGKVFGKLKTSKGCGNDGIASCFLKIALPVISESLCDIFNLSIATGCFPDSWKIARVAPIFKSGQPDDRSNYRPISVLPVLARVFEKLIHNQLYDYLDRNKHLFSNQSGFRALHSVVTCLLHNTDDWYVNMDDGRYTANIFIDLKKAFDTVDHDILLAKLRKYGVENLEHSWFTSYLSNRKQFCKVNRICSKTKDIHCGVPQGSCLGPLLFLIYINDLPFALKKGKVTMYADDTSISYSSSSLVDIEQTLDSELNDLKLWMQGNKLSLNVLKTQAMVVGSKPKIKKITDKIVDHPKFFIGGSQVENVDRAKYLGVIIDKNLNWEEHISNVRTKVSRAIGFLKYSRKFLPQNTLSKMYSGIVEPHFRFCCSVWGCCGVTKLQTLQKLQNRAARIVTKSNFDTPSIDLIQSLNWPTVSDIIRGETATTVYKSLNGLVPEYLSSLFEKRSTRNVRELRNTETDLSIPLRKSNNGQRAISFRGPKLWNTLELDVKQAPSLATFKRRIKS